MPMNRHAKFDSVYVAASFILGEEIMNHTNTHTNLQKKTVTDISIPSDPAYRMCG